MASVNELKLDRRGPGTNAVRSPAAVALLVVGILVLIPYLVPGLERLRLLQPLPEGEGLVLAPQPQEAEVGEAELPPASEDDIPAELAQPEQVQIPAKAQQAVGLVGEQKPPRSIEDPSGQALDAYFRVLEAVQRKEKGALARAAVWGDSNVASDLVTSVLRRKLQQRFGDGGHGYVLLARPSRRYFHNDVEQIASAGWAISRIPGPLAADRLYGLGGTSFRATGKGAFARLGTATKGSYGRQVSRFVINYLAQPEGKQLAVLIDGQQVRVVDTKAAKVHSAKAEIRVPDGPHRIELRSLDSDVRIFGIWLERDSGAVVDAVGVTACKVRYLSRIDQDHFAEQLRLRDLNLLIFNFGVNESREGESMFGGLAKYESTLKEVLTHMKKALPTASCLVVAPNDIAFNMGAERPSFPLVAKLRDVQRKVAGEVGCAFWDMHTAMGGEGSMGKWVLLGLGEGDMLHPTKAGAEILGSWLYLALMEAFDQYKQRQAATPSQAP